MFTTPNRTDPSLSFVVTPLSSDALESHVAAVVGAEVSRTLAKCGLAEVVARLQEVQVRVRCCAIILEPAGGALLWHMVGRAMHVGFWQHGGRLAEAVACLQQVRLPGGRMPRWSECTENHPLVMLPLAGWHPGSRVISSLVSSASSLRPEICRSRAAQQASRWQQNRRLSWAE